MCTAQSRFACHVLCIPAAVATSDLTVSSMDSVPHPSRHMQLPSRRSRTRRFSKAWPFMCAPRQMPTYRLRPRTIQHPIQRCVVEWHAHGDARHGMQHRNPPVGLRQRPSVAVRPRVLDSLRSHLAGAPMLGSSPESGQHDVGTRAIAQEGRDAVFRCLSSRKVPGSS
ncbi:hypothetical protein C8Q80DRAFT_1181426 [Daedaleopsis nitida]|nr:hypothetical protein C8Q80DRAFT_1181426 [Daedaleopsis nitida]